MALKIEWCILMMMLIFTDAAHNCDHLQILRGAHAHFQAHTCIGFLNACCCAKCMIWSHHDLTKKKKNRLKQSRTINIFKIFKNQKSWYNIHYLLYCNAREMLCCHCVALPFYIKKMSIGRQWLAWLSLKICPAAH